MRALLLVLALSACDLDLERMGDQPRFTSYERCDVCPNGTIEMLPPEGAVARDVRIDPPEPADTDDALPAIVDRPLIERGRNRFDIFCAACHGRLGNGRSQVAENMLLRRPPSLITGAYRAGHIYRVVTHGFGLMRSYASELPYADRWAVIAYLRALELSQNFALDQLGAAQRQEAARWLE